MGVRPISIRSFEFVNKTSRKPHGKAIEMYQYEARIEKIIDGDTIEFTLDLGFHVYFREQMRLADYAAPEIKGLERELGIVAKQKLEELLPLNKVFRINSKKTDKYGRWLADVEWTENQSLSRFLINQGYGLPWNGIGLSPKFDPTKAYPLVTTYKDTVL